MAIIPSSSLVLFFLGVAFSTASYSPCFKKPIGSIPPDHLLYKKTKPLVIGHRGNPMKYQENTLDGFKSLLDTNADGFEVDIYLTKDDQLVAFHDDNAQFLTGKNLTVWEMTADELTKLTIKDSLKFGAWAMYSMALKSDSADARKQDSEIDRLRKMGVERFITDDVYRLLRKLGRPVASLAVSKVPCKWCYIMAFHGLIYVIFYI